MPLHKSELALEARRQTPPPSTPPDSPPAASDSGVADIPASLSNVLRGVRAGDVASRDDLFALLYGELRLRAQAQMRNLGPGGTMAPTELVHEAFCKLANKREFGFEDRAHFLAAASTTMRNLLIDHLRRRHRLKREAPGERESLDRLVQSYEDGEIDLERLDAALLLLAERDPEMAKLVEMRFFGGSTVEEVALLLGVSKRNLERKWQATRAWLYAQMSRGQ